MTARSLVLCLFVVGVLVAKERPVQAERQVRVDKSIEIVSGRAQYNTDRITIGGQLFEWSVALGQRPWGTATDFATFDVRGWDNFTAYVGYVDGGNGKATASVEVDGEKVWEERVQADAKPKRVDVALTGKRTMTIRITPGAQWNFRYAEPKLIKGQPAGKPAGTTSTSSTSTATSEESMRYWLKCPVCGIQFDKKDTLDDHIRNDHVTKATTAQEWFVCSTCGIQYDTKEGLDKHIKSRHSASANSNFSLDPSGLDRLADGLWKQCQAKSAVKAKVEGGNVAVATLKPIGGVPTDTPASVAADVYTAMIKSGFSLVERGQLDKVLKELKIEDTALIDPTTAGKIGKLSGADLMLLGEITDSDSLVVINARLMETATGRSVAAERVELRKVFARN